MAVDPGRSIYIGDARRDIESGRAAGTATVAVRYGYVEPGQDPAMWGADYVVDTPVALLALLKGSR
jgi:phosphoglycolate phosphatase